MKQHTIQKSWLKQFAYGGEVLQVACYDLSIQRAKPKDIAVLDDFQSAENEQADQQVESKVIPELYRLRKGAWSKIESIESLDLWVAMHLSRNPRELDDLRASGITYDRARKALISDSLETVRQFPEIWVLRVPEENEPLVLSDHPIVPFQNEAVLIPISRSMLLAYTRRDPRYHSFEGRTVCEAINEMSFASSQRYIFCDPRGYPGLRELKARTELRVEVRKTRKDVRIPVEP